MRYTEFYKKITKTNFDSQKYEVHHIDGDRKNNDISNLVALPKELHKEYHKSVMLISKKPYMVEEIISMNNSGYKYNSILIEKFENFYEIHKKCCEYCDYKEFLLGNLPNIHNLNYK